MAVDATTRAAVEARSDGVCEVCWVEPGQQIHHRRPRRMGGDPRPETDMPGNLIHASHVCHQQRIESNRTWAYSKGLLVPDHKMPAEVPVVWRPRRWGDRPWVLLDDVGLFDYTEAPDD